MFLFPPTRGAARHLRFLATSLRNRTRGKVPPPPGLWMTCLTSPAGPSRSRAAVHALLPHRVVFRLGRQEGRRGEPPGGLSAPEGRCGGGLRPSRRCGGASENIRGHPRFKPPAWWRGSPEWHWPVFTRATCQMWKPSRSHADSGLKRRHYTLSAEVRSRTVCAIRLAAISA
jgi:hypothetical protein